MGCKCKCKGAVSSKGPKGDTGATGAQGATGAAGADGDSLVAIKLTLTPAQVKTLNSVPITVVPAPGAGFALQAVTSAAFLDWGSVAYDHGQLNVQADTATNEQLRSGSSMLNGTADSFLSLVPISFSSGTQLVENKALVISAPADSTTTGDSPVTVYIYYKKITI